MPRRRRPTRYARALAGLIALAVVTAVGATLVPAPLSAAGPWDAYGGFTGRTLAGTSYFHTAQIDGRWWLITPDGHPFFSNGLNHVTPVGTPDKFGNAAYHDTILAKYGSEAAWADAQVGRFDTWGINTLGGWSSTDLFAGKGVPYTVTLGLAGQDSSTGRMADFWDPAWVTATQTTTTNAAAGRTNDPWLVGYFLDNELHWTQDWRPADQLDLYFQRAAASPGKAHLVDWLRTRYQDDFAAFAADFSSDATDWASLLATTGVTSVGPGAQPTRDAWAGEVAERFFSVAHAALRAADPNHLDLGARFLGQLITPEVLTAAANHVDVVSINWYEVNQPSVDFIASLPADLLPTADTLAAHARLAGKPLLITEFGWRAMDSGLPNTWPPLQVVLQTQAERAASYRNFGQCLANTGYVVGAHWFEMVDEPATGRFDGENDNWGFLTEQDTEYAAVTAAAADVHAMAYAPLTDPGWAPGPCTPVGPQLAAAATDTTVPAAEVVATPIAAAVTATPAFTG